MNEQANQAAEVDAAQVGRALLRSRRGMTLVEIMVVIAIITTVMGIIGVGVMQVYQGTRVDTTILQMGEINKRIELYSLKKGVPSTGEGLSAVYGGAKVPLDGWGHEFIFLSPGPNGTDYDLISYGKDGVEGGTGLGEDLKWSEQR
ncbi:MAG: type II secretion system protein GspG [Deltaproteobacteria bacterium]|nr:type II secretion system protein GspG [Deltaproteobacteria bacterium]